MIKVEFYRNKNKNICAFTVSGHADYAKAGSDIVCSAVSLLVFNTINSIEKFVAEKIEYGMEDNGGYITCVLPNIQKNVDSHDANLLLDTMVFGLKSLELEYNKYIHIIDKEV
jgi:uncharacterized protein YsxB (DUF464 family)